MFQNFNEIGKYFFASLIELVPDATTGAVSSKFLSSLFNFKQEMNPIAVRVREFQNSNEGIQSHESAILTTKSCIGCQWNPSILKSELKHFKGSES